MTHGEIVGFFRDWVKGPAGDTHNGCLLAKDEIQNVLDDYDEMAQWKVAVEDACVINWVPMTTPRETMAALHDAINRVALDPAVSEEAAKLVARAEEAEKARDRLFDDRIPFAEAFAKPITARADAAEAKATVGRETFLETKFADVIVKANALLGFLDREWRTTANPPVPGTIFAQKELAAAVKTQ